MKINLSNILKIFSILLGLLYCLFIIRNRLFRTRQLRDLINEINTYFIILYFLLAVISLILLLYNIKLALQLKTNSKIYTYIEKKPYILNSLAFIEKYILNAPKNFYEFLSDYIHLRPLIQHICDHIIGNAWFYHNTKNYKYIIYFFNNIKLIIALIFIYDILYVGKFQHFFKFLPLLIIPIIFQVFLYMIDDLVNTDRRTISKWINMEANETNTGYIVSLQKEYENDPAFTEEVIFYYADIWQAYVNAMIIIDRYYELEKKIKPYFNIIIYIIYFMGWSYILFNVYLIKYVLS